MLIRREKKELRLRDAVLMLACYAAVLTAGAACIGVPLSPAAAAAGASVCAVCCLLPLHPVWGKRLSPQALACVFAVLSAVLIALLPSAREGAKMMTDSLYTRSEALNAYAYMHPEPAGEGASVLPAQILCACFAGTLPAICCKRRSAAVAVLIAAAAFEAYFGVTAGVYRDLLLYAALFAMAARGDGGRPAGPVPLAAFTALAVAVFAAAPASFGGVEMRSEEMRDWLGIAAMRYADPSAMPERELNYTRQESRLSEAAGEASDRDGSARGFEKETVEEKEISIPHRTDLLKAAAMAVLSLLTIVVPFVPFLLLSRRKRITAERREAFGCADNAAAVRAMFAHTVDWLRGAGLDTGNRQFSEYVSGAGELIPGRYSELYADAVSVWQEAAYSGHEISAEKRAKVKELLDLTAAELYEKAGRRTRFRMKYIYCLCGSEG